MKTTPKQANDIGRGIIRDANSKNTDTVAFIPHEGLFIPFTVPIIGELKEGEPKKQNDWDFSDCGIIPYLRMNINQHGQPTVVCTDSGFMDGDIYEYGKSIMEKSVRTNPTVFYAGPEKITQLKKLTEGNDDIEITIGETIYGSVFHKVTVLDKSNPLT